VTDFVHHQPACVLVKRLASATGRMQQFEPT